MGEYVLLHYHSYDEAIKIIPNNGYFKTMEMCKNNPNLHCVIIQSSIIIGYQSFACSCFNEICSEQDWIIMKSLYPNHLNLKFQKSTI